MMRHFIRDLQYASRGLRRSPLFTVVATLSIALGIGANTAIFTLVDEVLLQLLPVKHPEQLVLFTGPRRHYGSNSGGNMLSFPMYEDFRDNFVDRNGGPPLARVSQPLANPGHTTPLFSGIFARRTASVNVAIDGQAERVPGELVSGTYFEVLGVHAAIGRVIVPDDDKVKDGSTVAVLSYDYWRNRFGSDPKVVGRSITINNYGFTIIGVSEAGFEGVDIGYAPSIRVPVMMKAEMTPNWDDMDNRRSRWVNVFARMKPGVTVGQVKATLQPFFHGLLEQEVQMPAFRNASAYTRDVFLKGEIDVLPASQGRSPLREQLSQPLRVLMAIVAGVLLIACANVASLLIARATARQKEIAVRLALGASRGRIVGQLLVESVLLATIGGLTGLLFAAWTTRFLLAYLPTSETPHVITGAIDNRMLAFNFALSVATGILFGLVPALRSTRPNLAPTLKDQVGAVIGGSGVRLRKGLVVAQVTLSVLLLVGAGLFVRSLRNLRTLDLGLRTDNLIAFNVSPILSGYTPVRVKTFQKQLIERIRALPGIVGAAYAGMGLLEGNEWDNSITVDGYEAKPGERMNPYCNAVSPSYFKTMGIAMVAGRDFDDRYARFEPPDPKPNAPPHYTVAIVNESWVKHYFGTRSPLGHHVGFGIDPGTKTPIEIIGVVRDSKYTGVRDDIPEQLFVPFLENDFAGGSVVYVRTASQPESAFGLVRDAVRQLDANIPLYNLRTLEHQADQSLLNERLVAMLSAAFGILATLLATIGLYGVMAYTVARRTREIGVRMALGAVPADVVWLVMREVLTLVGSGVVLGLIASVAATRLVATQLYGITPTDPVTIVSATAILIAVGLLAGYFPARRATRVNPVLALRYE